MDDLHTSIFCSSQHTLHTAQEFAASNATQCVDCVAGSLGTVLYFGFCTVINEFVAGTTTLMTNTRQKLRKDCQGRAGIGLVTHLNHGNLLCCLTSYVLVMPATPAQAIVLLCATAHLLPCVHAARILTRAAGCWLSCVRKRRGSGWKKWSVSGQLEPLWALTWSTGQQLGVMQTPRLIVC